MPNDDYIKRSDIEREIRADMDMQDLYLPIHFLKAVEEIPAADVEPKRRWIPVTERLPEEKISPMTLDYQAYPCVFRADEEREVRYYKFGRGHFWDGPGYVDEYITHWAEPMELPEVEEKSVKEADSERMLFLLKSLEETAERKGQVTVSRDFIREVAEIIRDNAEIIRENAEKIRKMKSGILIAKVPEDFQDVFGDFGECCFLSPLKADGEGGSGPNGVLEEGGAENG